jgi:hypothetical protein
VFVNDSSSVFPEPPLNIEIMFSQVVNNERSTLVTMTMALAHQE